MRNTEPTAAIMPPVRQLMCCGATFEKSKAGDTKLATMLMPMVAIIVLFAQELRRALAAFGRTPFFAVFSGYHAEETVSDLVLAATSALAVVMALLFWVGAYTLSRESQRLERRLGVGHR